MIKLSRTKKMPGPSWSLKALETCPGARDRLGDIVPACQGCYAREGFYYMPAAAAVRDHNREDWRRPEWISEMVAALDGERWFRWFDSGDVYSVALARKILAVMRATPGTRHWLPTRSHKFRKFGPVFRAMRALPNVVVRFSSDSVSGDFDRRFSHTSTIAGRPGDEMPALEFDSETVVCGAYTRGGRCGGCRACWDKDQRVIVYPIHGQRAARLIARGA